jgi:MinD-like ATPase involved in chromosome partitioning or flagellar assembly
LPASNGNQPTGEVKTQPQRPAGKGHQRWSMPVTVFGGQTDRVPTQGFRSNLYGLRINIGPSTEEINETERQGFKESREQLRRCGGTLCVGFYSYKGGDGKSVLSTMSEQLFHDINPVQDRVVVIDVNTSMTTLDELNGLSKEDFLKGKYWTMESLYDFIMANGGDIEEIDDLYAKLAFRTDPQLPIIPLQLKPTQDEENTFTGEQYLKVLRVLKKFFTIIVHDFGTETNNSLTRTALSQLHMLGVLTHSGSATTKMVGLTLEMLHTSYPELLLNTVVIFNNTSPPSDQALRALAYEKAGRTPIYRMLLGAVASGDKDPKEVQTPGQAMQVINGITALSDPRLVPPLSLEEVVLVGFDPHLKTESELRLKDVSPEVQAQLWTVMHRMLRIRAEHEAKFLRRVPQGETINREQMEIRISDKQIQYRIASYITASPEPLGSS